MREIDEAIRLLDSALSAGASDIVRSRIRAAQQELERAKREVDNLEDEIDDLKRELKRK
jgi:uncharacterized protein Yka (UPF0111/DUF47 family)